MRPLPVQPKKVMVLKAQVHPEGRFEFDVPYKLTQEQWVVLLGALGKTIAAIENYDRTAFAKEVHDYAAASEPDEQITPKEKPRGTTH